MLAWPLFISGGYTPFLQDGDRIARVLFQHYSVGCDFFVIAGMWLVGDENGTVTIDCCQELPQLHINFEFLIQLTNFGLAYQHGVPRSCYQRGAVRHLTIVRSR